MNSYNKEKYQYIELDNSKENYQKLVECLYTIDSSFSPRLTSYVNIEDYADKLINNAFVYILVNNENAFIGLFALYANDYINKTAYISSIGVVDKYKGLGYADLLMNKLETTAGLEGMTNIKLEVYVTNHRAIKFYEKHLFHIINEDTRNKSTTFMYKNTTIEK